MSTPKLLSNPLVDQGKTKIIPYGNPDNLSPFEITIWKEIYDNGQFRQYHALIISSTDKIAVSEPTLRDLKRRIAHQLLALTEE